MSNYIWASLIIIGIIFSLFTGKIYSLGNIVLSSTNDAFSTFFKMSLMILFWNGIFNILKDSGFLKKTSKYLSRILKFIFPGISSNSKALEYISITLLCNLLGLSIATTSTGLKAFECLKEEAEGKKLPTKEMIIFILLNINSITIFPTTIISIRNAYLGITDIKLLLVIFLSTCFGTLISLICVIIFNRWLK